MRSFRGRIAACVALLLSGTAACDGTTNVPFADATTGNPDARADVALVHAGDGSLLADGALVGCANDRECDDLVYCNGLERCTDGRCVTTVRSCDDGRDCTRDRCDEQLRGCVHTSDDGLCSNGNACDGAEVCDPGAPRADPDTGCLPPAFNTFVDCDDHVLCTMDRCDPVTGCVHTPRDVDGDRSVDHACVVGSVAGDDCNDGDPAIHPGAIEVCDDLRDNDCNGLVDYADPACHPTDDTCATATVLTREGRIPGSTVGLHGDATLSCSRSLVADAYFVFTLDAAADVEIGTTVPGASSAVAIYAGATCESLREYRCARGTDGPVAGTGVPPAVHARALPPGTYRVVVQTGSVARPFLLDFHVTSVSSRPPGDACPVLGNAPAVDVSDGRTVVAGLSHPPPDDYEDDVALSCSPLGSYPDAVYRVTVPTGAPQDLLVTATAAYGTTVLSLRRNGCADLVATEIACVAGSNTSLARARVFMRGIPPGTYWLLTENSRNADVSLLAALSQTAGGVALDRCPAAPSADGGATVDADVDASVPSDGGTPVAVSDLADEETHAVSLVAYADDYVLACNRGGLADAVFELTLMQPSNDVHIAVSASAGTTYASLRSSSCADDGDLACRGRTGSFVVGARALAAGTYWLVVENSVGSDVTVTATVDAAGDPVTYALTSVPATAFVDVCAVSGSRRVLTNTDDLVSTIPDPLANFAIPFDVRVYGVRVPPPFVVSTNGFLSFLSTPLSVLAGTIPAASEPTLFLAPYAADLATGPAGICYAITGEVGSQRLIVQWTNVREVRGAGQVMVFQAIVEEAQSPAGNNYLDVIYQQMPGVSDPDAFAGVENDDGSAFTVIPGPPWTAPRAIRLVPSR